LSNGRESSLRLLLAVQLVQGFRSGIVSPILALFVRGQGLTVSQIGLIGTASMLGWLIFEPVAGVIADRIRKRFMVIFAIVTSTFIFLAYPLASGFWQFAMLAFGMSSVMSAYAISMKALTAELLPKSGRGRAYGRFRSAISLGGIVSPIVGGYLYEMFGRTLPFYLAAGVGVLGLGAAAMIRGDEGSVKPESTRGESGRGNLMSRSLLGIFLVRALFIFNLVFRQHTLPIFLHESPGYQASESQIGLYMGLLRLSSALSQSFLGELNDRVGSRWIIASSLALSGASYLGMLGFSGVSFLLVIGVFQGVFFAAAEVSMMVYLMDVMPQGRTGMVMGLYSEAENVGGMIAAPSLGQLYDVYGPSSSVLAVAGVILLDSLISVFILGLNRRDKPE